MEPAPETDGEEIISLDDTLASLKRNAIAAQTHFQESLRKLKAFQHKLLKESKDLSESPLQPRTRMMKWLTDRGLAVESSFTEFFEVFIEEHKKEHRLDISKRTLCLNSAACVLFGYKEFNPEIPLFDLLSKLSLLYY